MAAKKSEFSAGGVVLHGGDVAVIVPTRRGAKGERVLALPKGHPEADETPAEAARREVEEETGLDVELLGDLGEVSYWYQRKGRRIAKRVVFFLFEFRSGSLEDHDHEIEEARWMPLGEARSALSYAGEREMVERALSKLTGDR